MLIESDIPNIFMPGLIINYAMNLVCVCVCVRVRACMRACACTDLNTDQGALKVHLSDVYTASSAILYSYATICSFSCFGCRC